MTPNRTRTVAIAAALVVVTALLAPTAMAATGASDSPSVAIEQQPATGAAVVTVTQNGSAVTNATVTVSSAANYSGTGTHKTDENGTVTLPNPNDTVSVTIVAKYDGTNVTENATLVPRSQSLAVTVNRSGDAPSVLVTQYDDPVENATVSVSVVGNESYVGANETHETDADGTVALPVPEDDVEVTITATADGLTAETQTTLVAPTETLSVNASQAADGGLLVTVTAGDERVDAATVVVENGSYAYAGTYTADDGTLSLPAPTQNVTVTVTATVDDRTATDAVRLSVLQDANPNNDFAEGLVRFIHFLQSQNIDGPLGQAIADYVHAHNPASRDGSGPPAHAGPPTEDGAETDDDRRGPPERAGGDDGNETDDVNETDDDRGPPAFVDDDDENASDDGDERGPPEHAGGDDGDEEADTETDEDRDDAESQAHGPPAHANGP